MTFQIVKKMLIAAALLGGSWSSVQAQPVLPMSEFVDQFEQPQTLNEKTTLVIFSADKEPGRWVKESLTQLNITDLNAINWLYVADVSAMPSFITNMMAIPKMKDFPFAIALDKSGDVTRDWPRKADQVSVYKMNKLDVAEMLYFDSAEALLVFLTDFKAQSTAPVAVN